MPAQRKPPGQALGHRRQEWVVLEGGGEGGLAVPPCPPGLLKVSERRWETFWHSGVASVIDLASDLPRLERWIHASDEFTRVERQIKASGRLVVGSMGQPVLNPLYDLLRSLDDQLRRAETSFGMTPKDRLALGLTLAETARIRQQVEQGPRRTAPVADQARRASILAEAVRTEEP
jgi:P27 family predicted phage terminase small subunit